MGLPRFVVIKSNYNNKYLRYIYEDVQIHEFLQFSGEEVVSPYAKFEVLQAKSGKGLVHIRSCYNNKYWVKKSQNNWWIVVAADEPEEDQSKWSCTLFEPEPVSVGGDANITRIRHVQLGNYACLWRTGPPTTSCLFAGANTYDKHKGDVFTIIDWESLLILPKHIAFKGDNGKYLKVFWTRDHPYLQFSVDDIGDEFVGNEVFTTSDGSIRLKNNHFGKFWRRDSSNWIWTDSEDSTSNNRDTLFWPIKVDNNVLALRNLGNNQFCKRLTAESTDCLSATIPTISIHARLEVEELVLSRSIYNVNFRLMDARIYGQNILTMATGHATNNSSEPSNVELKLSYTDTKSETWNASVSLNLGVKTSFRSGIPLIAEGKIEVSAEFSAEYQWGETRTSTNEVETRYMVVVPPMTTIRVSLLATMGSCDVPFSYSQRDTLTNGKQVTYNKDDGVYTGINCYTFKYETKQTNL